MARRRVAVDWDELEMALTSQMDERACYLDLRIGKVQMVPLAPFRDEDDKPSEEEIEAGFAEADLIPVEPLPSSREYGWMVELAGSVAEWRLSDRLEIALDGRGAFRRFKRVLADHPSERARWFSLRDRCLREAWRFKRT